MDDRLDNLLDECTAGLVKDTELRLKVQADLTNQIVDQFEAECEKGVSEEKSYENSLEPFSETREIAGKITDENDGRLKQRAKKRFWVLSLLIPLALMAFLFSYDPDTLEALKLVKTWGCFLTQNQVFDTFFNDLLDRDIPRIFPGKKYSDDEKLILNSRFGETDRFDNQKAIIEKFPDNKIFMGNYISALIYKGSKVFPDEEYVSELRKAEKLDPENARYNYALASYYCRHACEVENDYRTERTSFTLKDRKALDLGMLELVKGLEKEYYKTYSKEMLSKRLEILGEPKTLSDYLKQYTMASQIYFPGLHNCRDLAQITPHYAEILIKENKTEQVLPYLQAWKIMGTQIANGSCSLSEAWTAKRIFSMNQNLVSSLYQKVGCPDLADKCIKDRAILLKSVLKWKNFRVRNSSDTRLLRKYGGIMAPSLLWNHTTSDITISNLAPGQALDYILAEKLALMAICLIFIVMIIVCLAIMLRWGFNKDCGGKGFLFIPSLKDAIKISIYSVVIPIVAYYVLSRFSATGGRNFNIGWNLLKWGIQIASLALALLIVPIGMLSLILRKRFEELNVPTPKAILPLNNFFILIVFGVLLLGTIFPMTLLTKFEYIIPVLGGALALGALIVIMRLLADLWKGLFGYKQFACYYGTFAKTLILVLCGLVIILVALSKPYLDIRETYLIQNDPIMTIDIENPTSSKLESKQVEQFKEQIGKALQGE